MMETKGVLSPQPLQEQCSSLHAFPITYLLPYQHPSFRVSLALFPYLCWDRCEFEFTAESTICRDR